MGVYRAIADARIGRFSFFSCCGKLDLGRARLAGLVTCSAGKAAPLCLVLVSVVLYLFRWIYGEAVTAIPMNGGCYSVLINTTSKPVSAWAAALGVLAYLATGKRRLLVDRRNRNAVRSCGM